ncbi:hypothetical protein AbraIFM66951_007631 [Aspergillus brasiliensis]|uniref:CHAT domain-containing protein n=1 Tax=Aspergillus brasiliensis TaxID=319629 RepID=A0A9W5YLV1_9EURO|nr:hypothetical protein AbraCBS73388_001835 [Aspergillus brasiliensis]GKZ41076.1 hypothetical protein AbraIFM66951_007631 [Aspergillus brasiliensis]
MHLLIFIFLSALTLTLTLPYPNHNININNDQTLLSTSSPTHSHPLDDPHCNGTGLIDPNDPNQDHQPCTGDGLIPPLPADPPREGFHFENPSTNCTYVSQPHIWDSFKILETDMTKLFTLIHKNVSFTVVGHHPIAGHYNDLLHFYVNALRRVSVLFMDHADKFEIHPVAIIGGCESDWSVQEVNFKGVMNSGIPFPFFSLETHLISSMYAPKIMEALHKNEIWWNGTSERENMLYMPGPAGMPDLKELEGYMGYPDGRRYED